MQLLFTKEAIVSNAISINEWLFFNRIDPFLISCIRYVAVITGLHAICNPCCALIFG